MFAARHSLIRCQFVDTAFRLSASKSVVGLPAPTGVLRLSGVGVPDSDFGDG